MYVVLFFLCCLLRNVYCGLSSVYCLLFMCNVYCRLLCSLFSFIADWLMVVGVLCLFNVVFRFVVVRGLCVSDCFGVRIV